MTVPARGVPANAQAVRKAIEEYLSRTDSEREDLFRLYLNANVTLVTPLLLDLAALEGIALSKALSHVRPPRGWPQRPLLHRASKPFRHNPKSLRPPGPSWSAIQAWAEARSFRRTFIQPGVIIRDFIDPKGRFGIRPVGGMLGFTADIGECLLTAFGPTAELRLNDSFAETIMTSMVGRTLDQVVEHPIFMGKGYRILSVEADSFDGATTISFSADLVPLTIPFQKPRRPRILQ